MPNHKDEIASRYIFFLFLLILMGPLIFCNYKGQTGKTKPPGKSDKQRKVFGYSCLGS